MDTLRSKIIRLAFTDPDMREPLLALVRTASAPRKLREHEVEDAKAGLKSHKGQRNPQTGLKFGEPYTYLGKKWLVYDFQAEQTAPNGVTLALVSPDFKEMVQDVHMDAGEVGHSRTANEVLGQGRLLFDLDGTANDFSARTIPSDPPYNQTYEGLILVDKGPKRVYQTALKVIQDNFEEIKKKHRLYDIQLLVNEQVAALMNGKTPYWHSYYMPD